MLETERATVSLYGDCCYAPRDLLVGLRSRIGPGAVVAIVTSLLPRNIWSVAGNIYQDMKT